jgi:hypothetical protein
MSNKVADKIKQYKQQFDSDELGVERYLSSHQHKDPKSGIQYIGIEIECYSKMNRISLQKLFFKYDLEEYAMIGNDSSIHPNVDEEHYNTFELRLLIPQTELNMILKKFGRVFRIARLKVNSTCGLHVHIDMRQRDVEKSFQKFLNFQDALFAIVEKDRWNNIFCVLTTDEDRDDHHQAVNYSAYDEHETIEIRIHHGCVDTEQIFKWVSLLINVVDGKNVPQARSKKDVLKWKGLSKKLRGYVSRNFKPEWYSEKEGFSD